jgi:hypothetical protein
MSKYTVADDRPYTREETHTLVTAAHSLRDKAIILLMSSSGIRVRRTDLSHELHKCLQYIPGI